MIFYQGGSSSKLLSILCIPYPLTQTHPQTTKTYYKHTYTYLVNAGVLTISFQMLRPHRKSIHIPDKSAQKTQTLAAQKHERKQTATRRRRRRRRRQQQQHKSLRKTKPKLTKQNCKKICKDLKQHRTGSLVSCCQLLAKLLDSPQQPASFPLPVQSSTAACHGRPVCLSWALSALVHLCACSSERVFFGVCVRTLFFTVPFVVPMRDFAFMEIQRFIEFFGISIYFCFSLTFLAFQSIFGISLNF